MKISENVVYHPNGWESNLGGNDVAAIVTAVNGNLVNLTIFPDGQAPKFRTDVAPGKGDRTNEKATYEAEVKAEKAVPAAAPAKAAKPAPVKAPAKAAATTAGKKAEDKAAAK